MEAIAKLFYNNKVEIDTLLIGINPWLLNINHGDKRYLQFNDKLYKSELKLLLSFQYVLDNLKINKFEKWSNSLDNQVVFQDGSIQYSRSYTEKRWEQTDFIISSMNKNIYYLENFDVINTTYFQRFKTTINNFNDLAENVILVLCPYHPLIYDKLIFKVPMVEKAENMIKLNFEENEDFSLIGSFNPNNLNLSFSDFYDELHLSKTGINQLLNF